MASSQWQDCKNYGVAIIDRPDIEQIRLFYMQYSSHILHLPVGYLPESANWQGDNLIVRARNFENNMFVLRYTDFRQFQFV